MKKKKTGIQLQYGACLNCNKFIVLLQNANVQYNATFGNYRGEYVISEKFLYPKKNNFSNTPDIPKEYIEDYDEAVKVLSASPKASAALSRRLLQNILREKFKIKNNNLASEIQTFIEMQGIPSHLSDAVDAVRNVGNFAAHPIKNTNTGEIVPVETGEAEWLIEVIEALFDFVFIQPIKLERRRIELNIKLEEIGKPPMKTKNKKDKEQSDEYKS